MWESLKNVPLKKRVIVRTNLFELILEITLFINGTIFGESRNLYPRRGRGSLGNCFVGPRVCFGLRTQRDTRIIINNGHRQIGLVLAGH